MKKTSMNIPNTLSLIRCLLVPVFVATLIFMRDIKIWGIIVPAIVYGLTAFTDMLDGKIARKYNLVTDFGKFIDPLADKFMVISSMIAILLWMILRGEQMLALVFVWVVLIILLRELGVTSLRLVVAGKSGIVVAASMLGKIKTVSQMVGTVVLIVEPLIPFFSENHILSYAMMAIMAFTTLFSGIDYLKAYMPYIDSNK
ncbi:MAG: CDP-diacylglycerol--glycerol-3-phosphate 3-phosphatidyltransferase [Ruminococcaceae bacterium]|nr:CDP-diacylglycerol--glycerol-3-phosphate 3-phosphatidyltransferase [Oscillospiraceae bacterium]